MLQAALQRPRGPAGINLVPQSTAQTAAIVQKTIKDPATGNRDDCFLTASFSLTSAPVPPGNSGVGQAAYIAGNIAGNTLLCIACVANDWQQGPIFAGNKIIACSDPVNGAWADVGEQLNNSNDCNTDIRLWVKFNAQPLLTTSWTGTASVASGGILTIATSASGTLRIGQRMNSSSMPSVNVGGGETILVSLLSGTMGAPGSTYQLGGGIGADTFGAQAMTSQDVVLIQRNQTTNDDFADYPGCILLEISGTDGSSTYFGGANGVTAGAGTDNISTGNIVMPAVPGLFISLIYNGGADNAPLTPTAGTGFGNSQSCLVYNLGSAIGLLEWQHFSSLGTRAATGSLASANNVMSVGVAVLDHP